MRLILLTFTMLFSILHGEEKGLLNPEFIQNFLTRDAHWATLHGAHKDDLGPAILYYALVYSMKAKLCVCLGSGDGFVPRIMRQAQRDLCLQDSRTILIDGNTGEWGRPIWLRPHAFLRQAYPEIEILLDTTKNVSQTQAKTWQINYLHIDADRTHAGALQDFLDYLPYMAKHSIVALHDTGKGSPCAHTADVIKHMGYSIINFETFGTGVSLVVLP